MASNPFDDLLNRVQQGPLGLLLGDDRIEQLRQATQPQEPEQTQPVLPSQQPARKPARGRPQKRQPMEFGRYEQQYGLPEGYLSRTAQIESGMNPNAANPNSSAEGLFQFIDSTASRYGLRNKYDPVASTDAAARLARDNSRLLRSALGRAPDAAELYLAHQQGGTGAARLLANPDANAASIVGADAVRLNGGRTDMTAGEFANLWLSKFKGATKPTSSSVPMNPSANVPRDGDQQDQQQPQPMQPQEASSFIDKLIRDITGEEGGGDRKDGVLGLGGSGGGQTQQAALPPLPAAQPQPQPRTVAPETRAAITEIMAAGNTEPVYKARPFVRLELMREIGRERRRTA